jgi:hypothetical protein
MVHGNATPTLRTLLVLGRASNLPTIWSNCLAGWLLGGGGDGWRFLTLCFGASLLYVGGMFLNDAFDSNFDRQHRRERPIPSGAIREKQVWVLGLGWLAMGWASLAWLGGATAILGVLLVLCIVLYDAIHKMVTFAPVLMAACRFLLYSVAASAAELGVTGLALWSGLALGAYIAGVSYLASKESTGRKVRYWPCLFLAAPIGLALLVNVGLYQRIGFLLSVLLAIWVIWCLRYAFGRSQPNIGYSVSGLLPGIVLVDLLAVVGGSTLMFTAVFLALFVLALLLQRFVPAT